MGGYKVGCHSKNVNEEGAEVIRIRCESGRWRLPPIAAKLKARLHPLRLFLQLNLIWFLWMAGFTRRLLIPQLAFKVICRCLYKMVHPASFADAHFVDDLDRK